MAVDLSTRYPDHKEFAPKAKWLVEMALSNPSVLFNYSANSCKACGATVPKRHQDWHVKEHAYALKLISTPPKGKAPETIELAEWAEPVAQKAQEWANDVTEWVAENFKVAPKSQLQLDIEATLFDTLSESVDFGLDYGYGPLSTLMAEAVLSLTTEADSGRVVFCTDCNNDEGG